MSTLKNITMAMVAFQLALLVVNSIEIVPGVRMVTGEVTNNGANIDFQILNTTTSNFAVIANVGATQNRTIMLCPLDFNPVANWLGVNKIWCYTNTSEPSILERAINILISLSSLAFNGLILLLSLIWGASFGAIFMYTTLFSLIDPTLGTILGGVIGSTQAILVFWHATMLILSLWGGGGERE